MRPGQRMKMRRKQLNISVDTLAEMINVSRSTVFRYENGWIEKIPAKNLIPTAKALHTTVDFLMGYTDDDIDVEQISRVDKLFDGFRNISNSNEQKLTPEGELQKDVIVLHRNGERIEYHLTEEQLQVVKPLLDQLNSKNDPDF